MPIIKEDNGNIYDGNIKDGVYNGYGKLIIFDNNNNYKIYEGDFKNGKLNGNGKLIISDGTIFIGNFINNEYDNGKLSVKINNNKYNEYNIVNGIIQHTNLYSSKNNNTNIYYLNYVI